jgi:hypothetical protein
MIGFSINVAQKLCFPHRRRPDSGDRLQQNAGARKPEVVLTPFIYINVIFLPRQARDKHRKRKLTKDTTVFFFSGKDSRKIRPFAVSVLPWPAVPHG